MKPIRPGTSLDRVLEHREAAILLKQQAVLFRASHHSGPLEIELTRRNIEAAHIKDVLAFLLWAENMRDRVSGFRVIQLLPGAGPATAVRLLDLMSGADRPVEAVFQFRPPAASIEHWPAFVDTLKLVRGNSAGWHAELDVVCRWYAPHLERLYEPIFSNWLRFPLIQIVSAS